MYTVYCTYRACIPYFTPPLCPNARTIPTKCQSRHASKYTFNNVAHKTALSDSPARQLLRHLLIIAALFRRSFPSKNSTSSSSVAMPPAMRLQYTFNVALIACIFFLLLRRPFQQGAIVERGACPKLCGPVSGCQTCTVTRFGLHFGPHSFAEILQDSLTCTTFCERHAFQRHAGLCSTCVQCTMHVRAPLPHTISDLHSAQFKSDFVFTARVSKRRRRTAGMHIARAPRIINGDCD